MMAGEKLKGRGENNKTCNWRERSDVRGGSFFFFKQKGEYEMERGLGGSEVCIRDGGKGGGFPHLSLSDSPSVSKNSTTANLRSSGIAVVPKI